MDSTRYRLATALAGAALAISSPRPACAQSTTRVSVNSLGVEGKQWSEGASLSADGRFAAFASDCRNFAGNDGNLASDIFVRDRATGVTECVSVDPNGIPGNGGSYGSNGTPALSADGRFVAFVSFATNLIPGGTLRSGHAYLRDRATGTTELISVDSNGNEANTGCNGFVTTSADGRFVAFEDTSTNLAGGGNNWPDCFVRDRTAGTTERISSSSSGIAGNAESRSPCISADGKFVAFWSAATNLVAGDNNNVGDAFVRDRSLGTTERVSVDSSGTEADTLSWGGSISADGRFVAFDSFATNLVAGDTNGDWDIFLKDRSSGVTERVSVDSSGHQARLGSGDPFVSADGRFVAFWSYSDDLVPGDTNGLADVFLRDRVAGTTERVSVDSSGAEADQACFVRGINSNGECIAFESYATNLVPGDTNHQHDCFVHDRTGAAWSNYGAGFPGTNGIPSFTARANPVLGTTVTLDLANSRQQPTAGLLFVGLQQTMLHTNRGGDLLVDALVVIPLAFTAADVTIDWGVPYDFRWAGLAIELQALEADPGAAKGVSFTAGLELTLGF